MRALIVEDHELFAEALKTVLERLSPGAQVQLCGSAEAAHDVLGRETGFALVLLDLGLPGLRGRAAFELVQERAAGAPIVVISGSEPGADVAGMIRQGARGFLHKRSSVAELTAALRFVLDGGTHVPAELLARPSVGDVSFTPRQVEVLRLLAKGSSNKEIADALGCAEATVRVHVSTIIRLLGVENRTQVATSPQARTLLD